MNSSRITIVGIVIMVFGGIAFISGIIATLVGSINEFNFNGLPFYSRPIVQMLLGLLLSISGILILKKKKIGIALSILTSCSITVVFILSQLHLTTFSGELLDNIALFGVTGFGLIFITLIILLTRFVFKNKQYFT